MRPVVPALVLAAIVLGACASPATPPIDESATLVWPSAPAEPRIAFVRAFSTPEDLGISKSLGQRLVELLLGATQVQLVRPMAVVEAGGILYVGDPGAKGVHRFDLSNGNYALVGVDGGTTLPSPVGLARGDAGDIYVADSALGAVFLLRRGATAATRVALAGELRQPTGIAFDPVASRLYVVDTGNHRINVYAADGSLLKTIGQRGSGDGEFNFPTMIWRGAGGRLLVTDSLNFRTQIFDADGRYVAKFGRAGDGTGDSPRQKGVATDRYGRVYVVDSLLHAVQIFDDSGQFLLSIGGQGRERGDFWLPVGIFIDDVTIYVADSYNRRVQVFRYVGGPT